MILDFSKLALPALTGLISYLARSFTFLALLCTPAHSISGIFDISGFFYLPIISITFVPVFIIPRKLLTPKPGRRSGLIYNVNIDIMI